MCHSKECHSSGSWNPEKEFHAKTQRKDFESCNRLLESFLLWEWLFTVPKEDFGNESKIDCEILMRKIIPHFAFINALSISSIFSSNQFFKIIWSQLIKSFLIILISIFVFPVLKKISFSRYERKL